MYINWEFAIRNRVSFYTWNYFHMQLRAESSETISHFRLQIPSQINSILSPVHSTQPLPFFWHTSKTDKQWISLSIHSLHFPFPLIFSLNFIDISCSTSRQNLILPGKNMIGKVKIYQKKEGWMKKVSEKKEIEKRREWISLKQTTLICRHHKSFTSWCW